MAKLVLFVWIMVLLCNLFYHLLLMLFFSLLDNITEKICLCCSVFFSFFMFNKYILIAVLSIFTNNIIKTRMEFLLKDILWTAIHKNALWNYDNSLIIGT